MIVPVRNRPLFNAIVKLLEKHKLIPEDREMEYQLVNDLRLLLFTVKVVEDK